MSRKPTIAFDPKEHRYTYVGSDPQYQDIVFLSATQFIGKFKNPFDGLYWSTYKAIKDYCESISANNWYQVKRRAGGWQNVVSYYKTNIQDIPEKTQKNIAKRAMDYRNDWNHKGAIANAKGTDIHEDLEVDFITAQEFAKERTNFTISSNNYFYEDHLITGSECYPECISYNLDYAICGMVDRIEREDHYLDITDYKTNLEIKKEPFMNQMMKVLDIPDVNYYHYTIQMSLYGWMLEKFGYTIRSLSLEHLITESRESKKVVDIVTHSIEYRPDLIEKMLPYRYKTPQ